MSIRFFFLRKKTKQKQTTANKVLLTVWAGLVDLP